MKTAFSHWQNRIAPVFDTARQALVVESASGRILSQTQYSLREAPAVAKCFRLLESGVDSLVCGAISRSTLGVIRAYGIRVAPFVAGNLRLVMDAWLRGNRSLETFAMPGCRRRRHRGRMPEPHWEEYAMAGRGRDNRRESGKARPRSGRRTGAKGDAAAAASAGSCVCPQCGHRVPHQRGVPCFESRCPKCGIAMTRQQ